MPVRWASLIDRELFLVGCRHYRMTKCRVPVVTNVATDGRAPAHCMDRCSRGDEPCRRYDPGNGGNRQEELTIDQLAQRTGMTVRNIRAHQSRGLLQPPVVRGRTGFYGPEHVARIELIKEMQADGFSLELIRRLVDSAGDPSSEFLRFNSRSPRAVRGRGAADHRRRRARPALGSTDAALLQKAQDLGLFRPLGDGSPGGGQPRLGRAGEELAELGVPAEEGLVVLDSLRRHSDRVAKRFVELFLDVVCARSRRPVAPRIAGRRSATRSSACGPGGGAVLAVFQIAMGDAVEKAFGREMERIRSKGGKRSR